MGEQPGGQAKPEKSAKPKKNRQAEEYRLALVWFRNAWNMDVSAKALAIAVPSAAANVLLAAALAWSLTHRPPPRFFAVTPSGRAIPMEPLDTPLLSDARVLSYARGIIISAYNYNFANIRSHLNRVGRHFTTSAWKQFIGSLQANDVLQSTISKKRTVTAVPEGPPVIVAEHSLPNGRYGWKINMPIMVNYNAGSRNNESTAYYSVTIVMVRTRVTSHPDGVAVAQFVVQPMSGG